MKPAGTVNSYQQIEGERTVGLLILGKPRDLAYGARPGYRGTYRHHPYHRDDLPETDIANQLFQRFLTEGGESGIIHDIAFGRRLIQASLNAEPRGEFELVEVLPSEMTQCHDREFLGCDLSCGMSSSLLYLGLEFPHGWRVPSEAKRRLNRTLDRYRPSLKQKRGVQQSGRSEILLGCTARSRQ